MERKFVQVTVTGQCERDLIVESASLNVGNNFRIVPKFNESSQVSCINENVHARI